MKENSLLLKKIKNHACKMFYTLKLAIKQFKWYVAIVQLAEW